MNVWMLDAVLEETLGVVFTVIGGMIVRRTYV